LGDANSIVSDTAESRTNAIRLLIFVFIGYEDVSSILSEDF
jgi:hypothetical protein